MAHVKLEGISKAFGGEAAVSDLDLDIEDGQFFVLLGHRTREPRRSV
jgi:multiple sugar transport system ATP-binding protein